MRHDIICLVDYEEEDLDMVVQNNDIVKVVICGKYINLNKITKI